MKNEARKDHGERHPNGAPDPCFLVFDCVSFTIEETKVQAQHGDDEDTES